MLAIIFLVFWFTNSIIKTHKINLELEEMVYNCSNSQHIKNFCSEKSRYIDFRYCLEIIEKKILICETDLTSNYRKMEKYKQTKKERIIDTICFYVGWAVLLIAALTWSFAMLLLSSN